VINVKVELDLGRINITCEIELVSVNCFTDETNIVYLMDYYIYSFVSLTTNIN
jgi:hypothetical protein